MRKIYSSYFSNRVFALVGEFKHYNPTELLDAIVFLLGGVWLRQLSNPHVIIVGDASDPSLYSSMASTFPSAIITSECKLDDLLQEEQFENGADGLIELLRKRLE